MLAAGVLVAPVLLRRATAVAPEVSTRTSRAGPAAGLAALVATLLSVAVGPDSQDVATTLTTTPWGAWWVVHVVGLVVATVGLSRVARTGIDRPAFAMTSLALVVAAVADTAAGHAAELPRGSALAVAVATVHVAAAGVWFGTLVVLGAALLPSMRRDPATRRPLLLTVWRAFSPLAAVSVVALVVSGLCLAGLEIPTVGDLTSSWYGWAATAKTAALVAAVVTAAGSILLVHPGLVARVEQRLPRRSRASTAVLQDPARFARNVTIELAVLGAAVVLAAVMTTVQAPRDAVSGDGEPLGTAMADGLFVSFASLPADVGERRIVVRVNAVTRPQPGPVTSVDLLMTDPNGHSTTASTRRVQKGRFEATVPASPDPAFHVWVAVHRTGAPDAVADLEWSSVSTDEGPTGFRIVTWSAAGLLALVSVVVGAQVIRRRRTGQLFGSSAMRETPAPDERKPAGVGYGERRDG
jgi:copper transport protein